MSLRFETTIPSSPDIKPRRQRPKIEKSPEEFKQHERLLMNKRNQEVNNAVTKKCHVLWNQFLSSKPKPNPLQFNFVYHHIDKYLNVCDSYQPSQHKDPKQKWWNNQKASEMSQQFLPSILNATDEMAHYLGKQILDSLRTEFTNYCIFELLETAITAVFSTMRSGSNEVFLRTSFQYSKANLRKKLVSYFCESELRDYDLKQRKKKDLWSKLIKKKRDELFGEFSLKKRSIYGDRKDNIVNIKIDHDEYETITNMNNCNNNNSNYNNVAAICALPPSIHSVHSLQSHSNHSTSDTLSCSTSNNSVNNNNNINNNNNMMNIPPINWNECDYHSEYQPFRAVSLSTPYGTSNDSFAQFKTDKLSLNSYAHHRQCTDCLNYMHKMTELLNVNRKLQEESNHLKQLNHEYVSDGQKWRNKYQNLLAQVQQNTITQNISFNNNCNAAAASAYVTNNWCDAEVVGNDANVVGANSNNLDMIPMDANGNWQRFDV